MISLDPLEEEHYHGERVHTTATSLFAKLAKFSVVLDPVSIRSETEVARRNQCVRLLIPQVGAYLDIRSYSSEPHPVTSDNIDCCLRYSPGFQETLEPVRQIIRDSGLKKR